MASKEQSFSIYAEYHNKNVVITQKDGTQERVILSTSMTDREIKAAVEKGVPLLHFGGDTAKLARFQTGRKDFKRKLKSIPQTTLAPPKNGTIPVFAKKVVSEISDENKAKMLAFDLAMNTELSEVKALEKAKSLLILSESELEAEKELLKKAFSMGRWNAEKAYGKIHNK